MQLGATGDERVGSVFTHDVSIKRVFERNPADQTGDWAKDEIRAELLTGSQSFLPYPLGHQFAPADVKDARADGSSTAHTANTHDDSSVALQGERVWLESLM